MRNSKARYLAVLLTLGFASVPAHAGVPVIDVAGLVQSIMEVLNSVEQISNQVNQIQNQVDQISQAEESFNSMTGSRNLGNVFNNPALQNYLPANSVANYNALAGGYDQLNGFAKQLRDAEMIYNCMDKEGDARRRCQASFARPYQQKASMQTALQTSNGRMAQINALMQRINGTQDPKEIAELGARIEAENAMLMHEMARAQYAQAMFDADQKAEENRQEEMRMDMLSRNGSIMDQVPQP